MRVRAIAAANDEIDNGSDHNTEEPAIDPPPRRQHRCEEGQDRREDAGNTGCDEGFDVPATREAELTIFIIERFDMEMAFSDQIIIRHHHAEDRAHG